MGEIKYCENCAMDISTCDCADQRPASAMIDRAWNRFNAAIADGPDTPFPGMCQAFERYYSQSWADIQWRNETSVWAAAWKESARSSDKLAARDREIAELRKAFERAEADVQVLNRDRDEARECVKRLYSDFTKIRNDCVGCMKDMFDTYLAATPEHLRNG